MDKDAFDNFLKTRYYYELNWYKDRAFQNQQSFKRLQWFLIIFSMITSILVGSEQLYPWIPIKFAALTVSVIVSGLATALKTFSYQEKWAFYKKMSTDLENEFDLYISNSESYSTVDDKESHFITRVRSILNDGDRNLVYSTIPRSRSSSRKGRK